MLPAILCGMARRGGSSDDSQTSDAAVDLNEIVSYNLRAARELRGWTQEDLADRLESIVGTRPSLGNISSMERYWQGGRRRAFTLHQIGLFALAFDLPILWFLLPPPGDHREIREYDKSLDHLYILLLGREDQLPPLYDRLQKLGIQNLTPVEESYELITGVTLPEGKLSYKERRKAALLEFLDEHGDGLDRAFADIRQFIQHADKVGIRGFVAAQTGDSDFLTRNIRPGEDPENTPEPDESS